MGVRNLNAHIFQISYPLLVQLHQIFINQKLLLWLGNTNRICAWALEHADCFLIPIFIFLGVNDSLPFFHFVCSLCNYQKFIFQFSSRSITLSVCFYPSDNLSDAFSWSHPSGVLSCSCPDWLKVGCQSGTCCHCYHCEFPLPLLFQVLRHWLLFWWNLPSGSLVSRKVNGM